VWQQVMLIMQLKLSGSSSLPGVASCLSSVTERVGPWTGNTVVRCLTVSAVVQLYHCLYTSVCNHTELNLDVVLVLA
jgi:hypothetical protein